MEAETLDLSSKLAQFTAGLRLDAVPVQARENAKVAILDCLGVAVLATQQEIGTILINFARNNAGTGPCTIWGMSLKTTPRDAALINGTLAHGLDYDDRNHSSTYTLAAAFAAAEARDLSGKRMIEGFIAGREVRSALDGLFSKRSSGIGPGARGWHSNGILGPIAAACSVSKICDLNIAQTRAAIGLAAGSCGALTRDGGTMAKPFRVGQAAATGMTCALLAKEGFTSDDSALEGRYGLTEALGPIPEEILDDLASNLGKRFDLETNGVNVKPFASCTATHSGLEAMLRLGAKNSISPTDVEAIEADLKPYPLVRQRPTRGFEGRFSMPFCLAMTLVHRSIDPSDFTNKRLFDPLVQQLISRTHHVPDSRVLNVILKDGTRISEPIQPHTNLKGWDAVAAKFQKSVAGCFADHQQQKLLALISRLEELPSTAELARHLCAA
ncbi:MAG TPA: MmgE/PrpD family protein [Candidatus Binatia bacterium]|jgi:2-methylcitrate dehydratase PrpD